MEPRDARQRCAGPRYPRDLEQGAWISGLTSAAPLAIVIFLVTIGLVIARPRRLTEARAALIGAAVMVLAGLVAPVDASKNVAGHRYMLPQHDSNCFGMSGMGRAMRW